MSLSPQHRTYLINEQIIGPAVINFAINALNGWWFFRTFAPIPMWTIPGVAFDLLGIFNGLPFLLTLITTPIVRHQVRKGKVLPLPHGPEAYPVLRRLPRNLLWRSTYLGIAAWLIGGPVLLFSLWLVGDRMELTTFWIVKGTISAVLAAIMAPIASFYTLAQESQRGAEANELAVLAPQPSEAPAAPMTL